MEGRIYIQSSLSVLCCGYQPSKEDINAANLLRYVGVRVTEKDRPTDSLFVGLYFNRATLIELHGSRGTKRVDLELD